MARVFFVIKRSTEGCCQNFCPSLTKHWNRYNCCLCFRYVKNMIIYWESLCQLYRKRTKSRSDMWCRKYKVGKNFIDTNVGLHFCKHYIPNLWVELRKKHDTASGPWTSGSRPLGCESWQWRNCCGCIKQKRVPEIRAHRNVSFSPWCSCLLFSSSEHKSH